MLTAEQAKELKAAGLTAYNHNLGIYTSKEMTKKQNIIVDLFVPLHSFILFFVIFPFAFLILLQFSHFLLPSPSPMYCDSVIF